MVTVAPAPPPGPVINPTSSVPVKEVKEVKVPAAVSHYSSAQIAALLGLPANGAKLSGLSPLALGRQDCPPACKGSLRLYARVGKGSKTALIGTAKFASTPLKFTGNVAPPVLQARIVLDLNATGRRLLRGHRTLPCTLQVSVEGQEGGSWQISRSLKLTGNRNNRIPAPHSIAGSR